MDKNLKLFLTAIVSSLITAGSILTLQAYLQPKEKKFIKFETEDKESVNTRSISGLGIEDDSKGSEQTEENEVLIKEQLSRNLAFLGEDGLNKVRNSFVIIVGCGGVGSWAGLMLARSGVQKIRVIDFDQVTLSSLNRHATATREDVGTPKVIAFKRHIKQFAPFVKVDARVELFDDKMAEYLLEGNPDYVLDCIDNIHTKVDLLKFCYNKNIPVISSMGAGAKADPSRIQISDISETIEDPLARAVRVRLRKENIITGVTVVYSTEKPSDVKLLPLDETQQQDSNEYSILPDFRSRILPVLGTLPAIFGMTMASYYICKVADHPMEPLVIKQRDSLYRRMQRDVMVREKNVFNAGNVQIFDLNDISYIVEEIWRSKSALSNKLDKLVLTRWDKTKPLSIANVILLTKPEADKHDKIEEGKLNEAYDAEFLKFVEERFEVERRVSEWRKL
ncbi:hypothetical protein CONCODRAFT_14166 [Conidiobolus coronatus NRRL 28638]|uniref:THIF-type NAD/FAD binding fold domain-containing protein n=1 Tax=Conidiobolus coronatus (strain ATCC 28846 / CBS 209.66 / NRRL 28638) TaxID=796925 RepID=A0A137NPI1_CONC2|nr:hypothetical protein CONCODRAFT_14166 [Conidiobolus coronatus NRRL 28638]|eukprot:KXN64647.1 hypothetical protein CONCODRAFT_14166 [Conidiobolus coronatus NRRL 28638]